MTTATQAPWTAPASNPLDPVLAYHLAIDRGHATRAIDLFTDDAVFEAAGRRLVGRQAIREFLTEREARVDRHTVHVVANTRVVGNETEATVSALVLLHVRQADGSYQLDRVLDTEHVLRLVDGRWLVVSRASHPLHADPA